MPVTRRTHFEEPPKPRYEVWSYTIEPRRGSMRGPSLPLKLYDEVTVRMDGGTGLISTKGPMRGPWAAISNGNQSAFTLHHGDCYEMGHGALDNLNRFWFRVDPWGGRSAFEVQVRRKIAELPAIEVRE